MKKIAKPISLFVIILLTLLQFASPLAVHAAPSSQASAGGLSVSNAVLVLTATPGMVFEHKMDIGTGEGGPAMDLNVEVMGFGEGEGGEFIPLPPEKDSSPFSARTWITRISNPKFHLDSGGTVEVDATVTVPQNAGSDTRYAIIYIHSDPVSAGGGIGKILSISVPVIITPTNAALNQTGSIIDLKVLPVGSGKPIKIQAMFKNTGNRHYRIKGQADIADSNGNVVSTLIFPVTSTSVFPTFTRQVNFIYSGLDQPAGLKEGKYGVDVKILREDGVLLDEKKSELAVSGEIAPFADIDSNLVALFNFSNQEPGLLNAKDKADLEIQFEGTGPVTGSVALAKYPQEPNGSPRFSDEPGNGGTGRNAVKFAALRVSGFSVGMAHITFYFKDNELSDAISASSLFLAYRQGNSPWRKLDNLEVQSGAGLVRGDLAVPVLAEGVTLGLGGGDLIKTLVTAPLPNQEGDSSVYNLGLIMMYGGAGLGGLVIIGLVIYLLITRKK